MKIRTLKAEVFRADRRIDLTKLRVAFRNFANAPKNEHMLCLGYDFRLGAVGTKRIGKITSSVRYRSIVDYRPLLNNINFILHVVNVEMLLRNTFFRDVHQHSEYLNEISKCVTEATPGNFYGLCLVYTEKVRAKTYRKHGEEDKW